MQTVERAILLKNGPPWGFRLAEFYPEGLVVSQIRRQSPAELAGLRENDRLLAIENISTEGMGRMYAVQLINDASYELELIVQRQERRKKQVMTFFLDTGAARGRPVQQELTTRELTLLWEKEPTPPPPPPPRPPSPPRVQPYDSNVTPISLDRLLREFEVPKVEQHVKKRTFADSTFYTSSNIQYPSLEEQMTMAHKVAESIQAPANSESKGFNMFEVQRQRSEKFVKEGPEPMPDPIENATMEQLEKMPPLSPPPPPQPKLTNYPSTISPTGIIPPAPPPPPPPPGQPRSLQEFLEKVRLFPKSQPNEISPQVCFDLATALHTHSAMFAKRRAKSQAWEVKHEGVMGAQDSGIPQQVVMERPKLVSKLTSNNYSVNSYNAQQTVLTTNKTEVSRAQMPDAVNKSNNNFTTTPLSWQQNTTASTPAPTQPASMPNLEAPSKPNTWRPVKFNIPQAAT